MNFKHIGWGLMLGGVGLSVAEYMGQKNAAVTGKAFADTTLGGLEAKIPNPTPFQLGTVLVIAGGFVLWVWPLVNKGA